jgi:hypothetical protein
MVAVLDIRMLTLVFDDFIISSSRSKNSCGPSIIIADLSSADYNWNDLLLTLAVLALQGMHKYSANINLHIYICSANSCRVYFPSAYGSSVDISI